MTRLMQLASTRSLTSVLWNQIQSWATQPGELMLLIVLTIIVSVIIIDCHHHHCPVESNPKLGNATRQVVDRPTQLICISDIFLL